jgi:hypothetical protein
VQEAKPEARGPVRHEETTGMAVTTPDWLSRHGGELHLGAGGHSASVYFSGQLQYVLVPTPARGGFSCRVTETINGRRLDGGETWPTAEDAIRGGLEDLRKALGW